MAKSKFLCYRATVHRQILVTAKETKRFGEMKNANRETGMSPKEAINKAWTDIQEFLPEELRHMNLKQAPKIKATIASDDEAAKEMAKDLELRAKVQAEGAELIIRALAGKPQATPAQEYAWIRRQLGLIEIGARIDYCTAPSLEAIGMLPDARNNPAKYQKQALPDDNADATDDGGNLGILDAILSTMPERPAVEP